MIKKDKIINIIHLMRIEKPIGFLLLLWPALIALWFAAQGLPSWKMIFIFTLGSFLMRSAGCVINDIADIDFDRYVSRTKERPLTSGKLNKNEALVLFLILLFMSFVLVCFINIKTILMSFVALFLASIYPFMKRFTYFPQVFLGASFAWSIPMAYTAQDKEINLIAVILYISVVIWTLAYDTIYALVDMQDDKKINIKSTAIKFGSNAKLIISLLHYLVVLMFISLYYLVDLHFSYIIAVILAGMTFVYQQCLLRTGKLENYFKAFLNNNYTGLILFIGTVLGFVC